MTEHYRHPLTGHGKDCLCPRCEEVAVTLSRTEYEQLKRYEARATFLDETGVVPCRLFCTQCVGPHPVPCPIHVGDEGRYKPVAI